MILLENVHDKKNFLLLILFFILLKFTFYFSFSFFIDILVFFRQVVFPFGAIVVVLPVSLVIVVLLLCKMILFNLLLWRDYSLVSSNFPRLSNTSAQIYQSFITFYFNWGRIIMANIIITGTTIKPIAIIKMVHVETYLLVFYRDVYLSNRVQFIW